jgi:hypothetical protein
VNDAATPGKPRRRWACLRIVLWLTIFTLGFAEQARAQSSAEGTRPVQFEWNQSKQLLFASVSYRDVVDAGVRLKLTRGLPTTIAMTATIFRSGSQEPVATTAQTCKVTWHVWEEAYKIELMRPGSRRTRWTTTLEGVLRRCAEASGLLVATSQQLPVGTAVYMRAKVQVNPLSPKLLEKIKRWVSRPSATGTAGPGDALFGTFTGLFLQRIGDAERELKFSSKLVIPTIQPKQEQGES